MLKPKAYDAKPQVQDYKPQVYENLYYALGHFNLIQYLADDFIRCHIAGFCLVSQADTVAKYVVCHSAHILRNDITAALDERVATGSQGPG